MARSTMLLAMGAMFIVIARVSANAAGLGVIVFVGLAFVAVACALHLSAVIGALRLNRWMSLAMHASAWALIVAGTAWAVSQAPRPDLVVGMALVPPLVGIAGVAVRGTTGAFAWAFLSVSLGLSALLGPIALGVMAVGGAFRP